MKPRLLSFLFCGALIAFPCIASLAQVNTEALMRSSELGFASRIGINFGFNSGNSTFFRWQTEARSDYRTEKYYFFLVGNVERGTANETIFLNRGFIHFRGIWRYNSLFQPELFLQKEFNEFILLKERSLFGFGARLNFLNPPSTDSVMALRLTLGIGAMYENERFTATNPETTLFRSTNYLALFWRVFPRTSIQLISYYQVDMNRLNDYRLLLDGIMTISITDQLAATLLFIYRYDNEPVSTVARYDIDIRNGFVFSF